MVVLFCPDPEHRSLLAAVQQRQTLVRDADEFERAGATASCAIVIVRDLAEYVATIREFRLRRPFLPILLVTADQPDNARHLVEVNAERVAWLNDGPAAVASALGDLTTLALRPRVLTAVQEMAELHAIERNMLVAALAGDAPRRIEEWAKLAICSYSAMKHRLRRLTKAGLRLKLVLDANLLVAAWDAAGSQASDPSWLELGAAVEVDGRRLREFASRLTGDPKPEPSPLHARLAARDLIERIRAAAIKQDEPNSYGD